MAIPTKDVALVASPEVPADAVVLIDLSSIAHPEWHMAQSHPDANHASHQIVARVRALANGHPHVAICCDSGRSFRHDVATSYKANRPESEAPLHHQIKLAVEALKADGFPVWKAPGFEADDVIAAACAQALTVEGGSVLVVSADKDLLQLVGPRVLWKSATTGDVLDEAGVWAKHGVRPDQMRDYLTLVGDKADNIHGADGIGKVKAGALLAEFDTLDKAYVDLVAGGSRFKPATATALRELHARLETVRALVTLRTDVEIPFHEIAVERVPVAPAGLDWADEDSMDDQELTGEEAGAALGAFVAQKIESSSVDAVTAAGVAPRLPQTDASASVPNAGGSGQSLVRQAGGALVAPATAVVWERELDPRSLKEARVVAEDMFRSGMFSAYGTPQAVLSTIMVGRELGIPAMGSLRSIYIIEGKHSLSAALMVALVLKSGLAEFFEPVEFSETSATFETHRIGARHPVVLTHTIEMAVKAWPKNKSDWQKSFEASGWGRNPTDMLCARAQSRLARMVYPHLLAGLYTPEELEEVRQSRLAA